MSLKTIPPGHKIVIGADGKSYLQKTKRRRRRYKMSKAHRNKIKAGLNKFKIPVLTVSALAPPFAVALDAAMGQPTFAGKLRNFGTSFLASYTGIVADPVNPRWEPKRMMFGLLPLVGLGFVKSIPMMKNAISGVNRFLNRMGIPVGMN